MPQVSVGVTGVEALPPNPYRKSVIFENISSSGTIYLDNDTKESITTGTAGIRLRAGDSISLHLAWDGKNQLTDRWSAIADAAGLTLAVKETFD